MNIISKVSTGKATLFTSYWFICFPIGFLINLADKTGEGELLLLMLLIPFLWSLYGVWRCAFNVRYLFWGYIARGLIIANVLIVAVAFFASFATEIRKPQLDKSTMPANQSNSGEYDATFIDRILISVDKRQVFYCAGLSGALLSRNKRISVIETKHMSGALTSEQILSSRLISQLCTDRVYPGYIPDVLSRTRR